MSSQGEVAKMQVMLLGATLSLLVDPETVNAWLIEEVMHHRPCKTHA